MIRLQGKDSTDRRVVILVLLIIAMLWMNKETILKFNDL